MESERKNSNGGVYIYFFCNYCNLCLEPLKYKGWSGYKKV